MPKLRRRKVPDPASADALIVDRRVHEGIARQNATSSRARRRQAARADVNEFCIQVGRDAETGARFTQEEIHETFQMLADEHPRAIFMAHPESGKAIPLDTPIPTPDGFRTMGDLEVGDRVFGRDGMEREVTWVSPVQLDREVFEVEFDDGVVVDADADHRWLVRCANDRVRNKGRERVVTTREMFDRPHISDRNLWAVPVTGPVNYPEADLPIHPYAFGAWLGDGSTDSSRLFFTDEDSFIWERCAVLEGSTEPKRDKRRPNVMRATIGGHTDYRSRFDKDSMRKRLGWLGVLGDKRIPDLYLTASVDQRRQVLAGLLDTDGYAQGGGRIELTLCNGDLAADAAELIRSLGYKTSVRESDAVLEGRVVGRRWRMCFTAYDQVFCLPRKAERHGKDRPEPNDTCRWRSVVRVERAESVPVKCIAVDGDATYLMGRSYTVTHNTTQISILKLLHMMGENPNIHIAIVSKTGATSSKSGRAIREYIERNEDLREIYPDLRPGDKWEEKQFTVKRSSYSKDPTVQCLGLGGTLIGSRVDVLMFDDIMDDENTLSPAERKKVYRRVKAFIDRLSAKGVVWMLTNAWHPDDAAHTLEREGWPCFRFPVVDEDGVSNWPAKWDEDRIEQMRVDLGPLGFARAFLCKARDEGESPFDEDALDRAFEAGREVDLVHRLVSTSLPPGAMICTGVDLAVTKKKGSHLTSFATCLLWPEPDGRMVRQNLWVESGRWSSREIRDRFLDIDRRYTPLFVVENNAAQRWIIDIVFNQADLPPEERRMPEIVPFTTGKNKAHPQYGVEGLAVEIANDLWVFTTNGPCGEEVLALRTDMAYYQRGAHTGDRLMACFPEGARVTTDHGLVPIEDVGPGDVVLTHLGNWKEVTGTEVRRYEGPIETVKVCGQPERIIVTSGHSFYAAATGSTLQDNPDTGRRTRRIHPDGWGWVEAADLHGGRKTAGMWMLSPVAKWSSAEPVIDLATFTSSSPRKHGCRWIVTSDSLRWRDEVLLSRYLQISSEFAVLLGLYLAEGSTGGKGGNSISSWAFHTDEIELHDFVCCTVMRAFGSVAAVDTNGNRSSVRVHSVLAGRFFKTFGKHASKCLPWHFMGLSNELRVCVLAGWLLGDGHMAKGSLKGVSISEDMIFQMQQIAMSVGFHPSVSVFERGGNRRVFGDRVSKLHRSWKLSLPKHETKSLIAMTPEIMRRVYESSGTERTRTNSRSLQVPEGLAVRVDAVEGRQFSGRVYNLHVDDDHSYVVEGVAVHNCWFSREGMRRGARAGAPEDKDEDRDLSPAGFGSASAGVRIIG